MAHSFDNAIELHAIGDGRMRGATRPEWANMVGPFGGVTAATLLHAVEQHPDRIGDPLALTVNFAAPVADGEFDIILRPARTNRTNQHWIVELIQGDDVKTSATAVFGIRRDTWADTEAESPSVPGPEEGVAGGLGDLIVWAEQYDMRFVEGAVPGEGAQPSKSSTTTLWMRHRADRRLDYPALAALSDMFYPRIFLRHGGVVPAGTISMTTYFHVEKPQLDSVGVDFVLGRAHANVFSRGYFDQSARLWSRGGTLLATTHQIVYFKNGS